MNIKIFGDKKIFSNCCPTFLEAISDKVIKFEDFRDVSKELNNL